MSQKRSVMGHPCANDRDSHGWSVRWSLMDAKRANALLYPSQDNFGTFAWPTRDEIESLLVETH